MISEMQCVSQSALSRISSPISEKEIWTQIAQGKTDLHIRAKLKLKVRKVRKTYVYFQK